MLEKAKASGAGILALKTLGKRALRAGETRKWPKCWYVPLDDPEEALLATRFTMSLPVTAGPCPGQPELFRLFCAAAEQFTPLTPEDAAWSRR